MDCKTWFESKQANLLLVMVGQPELLGEDMDPSLTLNSRLSPHPNKVPEPDTNPARMAPWIWVVGKETRTRTLILFRFHAADSNLNGKRDPNIGPKPDFSVLVLRIWGPISIPILSFVLKLGRNQVVWPHHQYLFSMGFSLKLI